MKAAFLYSLVFTCSLSVALPRGWCCMLPAGHADETPPAAPAGGCCCCPVPMTEKPAEKSSDEPKPRDRDECPRRCCEREAATLQAPDKFQPDAALPAVILPTATTLTAAGPAAEVGAAAVPVAPLHVLHCLWLC